MEKPETTQVQGKSIQAVIASENKQPQMAIRILEGNRSNIVWNLSTFQEFDQFLAERAAAGETPKKDSWRLTSCQELLSIYKSKEEMYLKADPLQLNLLYNHIWSLF